MNDAARRDDAAEHRAHGELSLGADIPHIGSKPDGQAGAVAKYTADAIAPNLAQFTSLEVLVSSLQSQGSFLLNALGGTQQT